MHIQQSQGYVPRYVLGCWASISGINVSPHISGLGSPLSRVYQGRTLRFIAIVFKAYVDIAFLYSYVEYSQFRASIEVIFWLPLLPVCRGPSWLLDYVTVVSDNYPILHNSNNLAPY